MRCSDSHFRCVGFYLRRLSNLDPMEVSNEAEHKDQPVLPDGTWRFVSSFPCEDSSSCRYSSSFRTGACCIVRTVLNYQSLPTDTTCRFSTSDHRSAKLTSRRRRHNQLVLENVSMRLAHVLPQLTRFWQFRGADGHYSSLRSHASSRMEMALR